MFDELFKVNTEKVSIAPILEGMNRCEFIEIKTEIPQFMKKVLIQLKEDDESENDSPNKNLKQSFCTEFNQLIINFFGVVSNEFAKYIMYRMTFLWQIDKIKNREQNKNT